MSESATPHTTAAAAENTVSDADDGLEAGQNLLGHGALETLSTANGDQVSVKFLGPGHNGSGQFGFVHHNSVTPIMCL